MFLDTSGLKSGGLCLQIETQSAGEGGRIPYYMFAVMNNDGQKVGTISFRLGSDEQVGLFGHVGYRIDAEHRGHGYAAKACALVLELARRHGYDHLTVTCSPENTASRRTCEKAGGRFVKMAFVPPEDELYARGERQKAVYRIDL